MLKFSRVHLWNAKDVKFLGYVLTHAVKLPVTLNHEGYARRLPKWNISLPFREPNKAVTMKVGESKTSALSIVVRKRFDQPNICFAHSVLIGAITPEIFGTPFVIVDCHRDVPSSCSPNDLLKYLPRQPHTVSDHGRQSR
jgi:hypothetical protein